MEGWRDGGGWAEVEGGGGGVEVEGGRWREKVEGGGGGVRVVTDWSLFMYYCF